VDEVADGAGSASGDEAAAELEQLRRELARSRESEARYRSLFQASFEGLLLHDRGVVLDVNAAAASMLGYTPQELIGRHPLELAAPESKSLAEQVLRQPTQAPLEATVLRKDGSRLLLEVAGRSFPEQGRTLRLVAVRDLTEKKKLQEELFRAERLEAIGLLAGGIAHDFNNILTAVLGNVTLARMACSEQGVQQRLTDAEKALQRAAELTQQLLTFARGGSPVRGTASLGQVVEEAARFALHGSKVRGEVHIPGDLWLAHADCGQIGRVIQNLVLHAEQATPQGGLLTIRCANAIIEPGAALPVRPGRYVHISLQDQGAGIADEHLPRIFDPYYLAGEQRLGLRLAACFTIVRSHDGHIAVESTPGVGSTFHVYLPARPAAEQPAPRTMAPSPGAGRHILLLDDERPLREVIGRMLQLAGYQVTAVADSDSALAVCAQACDEGRRFAAAILDLTIPGDLGGVATLERLRCLDPELRAIASSGYTDDPVLSDFARHGFSGVLTKPYSYPELVRTMQRVVEEFRAGEGPSPAEPQAESIRNPPGSAHAGRG